MESLLMRPLHYLTSDLEVLADLKNYYRWILDEIRPFLGTRLAEIGAGIGTFTKLLANAHLSTNPTARLEAFEPADNLYPELRERLHHLHPQLLQAGRLVTTHGYFQASPGRFDSIIMINVLEHIHDDLEAIRIAHQSLSRGGTFVVFAPALPWLYSPLDRAAGHHRRYEKKQLEKMFHAGGFEVMKAKYMDCAGVLPWYVLNVIGGSLSLNPRMARMYDKWVVPATRWFESIGPAFVGKNILMIGQKPGSSSTESPSRDWHSLSPQR